MANIFDISQANPLKFYKQSDALNAQPNQVYQASNPNYNHTHIDNDFFVKQLKSWQDKVTYYQPFQQGDTIVIQNNVTDNGFGYFYTLHLITCKGKIVKSVTNTPALPIGTSGVDFSFNNVMPLYDVPEGIYFAQLVLSDANGSTGQTLISEPIEVKTCHENTMLIEYRNSTNDQHIIWQNLPINLNMQVRVHCALTELTPQFKGYVYEDEPYNTTLLSGIPYRDWSIIFGGDMHPITEWLADKLNRIFCCDTTIIDGKAFTRGDNAQLEAKRVTNHPLMAWELKLRERYNETCLSVTDNTQALPFQSYTIPTPIPTTERFYVKSLFSLVIEKQFTGASNFLAYLNTEFKNTYNLDGTFALNSNNEVVFTSIDSTEVQSFTTFAFDFVGILPYCLELGIDTTQGGTFLEINIDVTTAYAVILGDSTQINHTPGTAITISHTYATNLITKAYVFVDDATLYTDNTGGDAIINSIGGTLAPSTIIFDFQINIISFIENNIFLQCIGALSTVIIQGRLNTNEINKLITYMQDALYNNSLATTGSNQLIINAQTPPAPPTADAGISLFISNLSSNNWLTTTD